MSFSCKDGVALTPPISAGLLPGITREFLLELAKDAGIPARETRITPADLDAMDEVFITGTTREVTPVTAIDGRAVGTGRPGPVTVRLLTQLRERVEAMAARKRDGERQPPTLSPTVS